MTMDLRGSLGKKSGGERQRAHGESAASDLFRSTWGPKPTVKQQADERFTTSTPTDPFYATYSRYEENNQTRPAGTGTGDRSSQHGQSKHDMQYFIEENLSSPRRRYNFRHLLPTIKMGDGTLRVTLLAFLRFPLQFCRRWQTIVILSLYLCIFLMLHDLTVRRGLHLEMISRRENDSNFLSSLVSVAPDQEPAGMLLPTSSVVATTTPITTAAPTTVPPTTVPPTTVPPTTHMATAAAPSSAESFKIYILSLEEVYNTGCLGQLASVKASIHQDFSDNGLGPVLDANDDPHIHETSDLALEVIFHARLKASLWYTSELSQAHAVFVPYYAALHATYTQCHDSASMQKAEETVADAIASSQPWKVLGGSKFFTVLGLPEGVFLSGSKCEGARDAPDTASSWLCNKLLAPMTVLLPQLASATVAKRRAGNSSLVIPMPSMVHMDPKMMELSAFPPLQEVQAAKRDYIIAYLHNSRISSAVATNLNEEVAAAKVKKVAGRPVISLDLSLSPTERDIRMVELMRRSRFCLIQPGQVILPTLLVDTILLGCIPVIAETVDLPFMDNVAYDKFLVTIPAEEIAKKSFHVVDHLAALAAKSGEMFSRRSSMRSTSVFLQYSQPETGSDVKTLQPVVDAFNLAMEKVISKMMEKY